MTAGPPAHDGGGRLTRRESLALGVGAALAWLVGDPPALAAGRAGPDPVVTTLRVEPGAERVITVVAPRRFDLVGVRAPSALRGRISIRGRPRGGRWTDWTPLPTRCVHAPDGRAAPSGEPVWLARCDELQLRADRPLAPFTLATVSAGALGGARALAAQAPGAPPAIISREEWGGDRIPPREPPDYGEVQLAFVHHTVSANTYAATDSASMVQAIAAFHRDVNGWNDIGYNFLVDRYGQVFEGRAGGIDRAVVGAHAQGYNSRSTGIALLGTHTTDPPTPAALAALGRLIGWKLALHGVPLAGTVEVVSAGGAENRFPAGRRVTLDRISGHRDGDATTCPGDAAVGQLPAIRQLAQQAGGAGPAPAPQLTVTAGSRRVARSGPGVLVRGQVTAADGAVRLAISRQERDGRWRWIRTVAVEPRADGGFERRVRLPTAGLHRVTARCGTARAAPLFVRSVRR